jgi:hypothetical protein
MENLLGRFFSYANTFYSMFDVKSKVKDDRKSPQISPSVIFLSLLFLVLFKKRSFLQLDQFMRTKQAKRFIGRDLGSRGYPLRVAVSDSTIPRSLETYHLQPLRSYLKTIYTKARHTGKCKVDVYGKKFKLACVDGSLFGKFYGCVLQLLGEANLLLDIEVTTGKGKEIPTTRALLDRAFREYGEGFVDIFLLDALYADKQTINLILSNKSHFLMKTEETSLTIIKDADSLFKCWKTHPYVKHIVGFDSNRLCEYEMWYCDSFPFPGVSKLMNVAHVKESYVKTKRQEDFWVLCTDESLTGEQLRELGHIRWRIENNGFKQLNAQTNCDHVYTHDEHSFEALMLLIFIGWNLVLLYNLEDIRGGYEEVKWTLDFLSELLLLSFYTEYQVID